MGRVTVKRIYDPPLESDGCRVLVDRLWPRGISKDRARIDHWLKDIAPSRELRTWFHHDPEKWEEFKKRYRRELQESPEPVAWLKRAAARERVTLLFSAADERHNNAAALKSLLRL